MQRERVSENVYWFQSESYAQVSAGAVIGPQWAVLIDTLMPEETLLIKEFLEKDLHIPVRYIINTHHHADHCWGNSFFPGALVIGHKKCREHLLQTGVNALEVAEKENPIYKKIKLVPPQITFDKGSITLKIAKKQLRIFPTPGHSEDGISVLIEEDRVLFAGDAFMALPFIVEGDVNTLIETTKQIVRLGLENIIQGHGEIILRGEIEDAAKENIAYLRAINKAVHAVKQRKYSIEALNQVTVESCGKNHIYLAGLATALHRKNLRALYNRTESEEEAQA